MPFIPIVLTPLPVPANAQAMNWDQLITLVCQYIQGSISASVSFFNQGSTSPTSNQGIFFNTLDNRFENWDTNQGSYIPISERQVGEIYPSFVGGDDIANGLVVLDGRSISSIAGLSQQQLTNLQTLFGANASIPLLSSPPSFSGLPPNGTFSGINNPQIQPRPGAFSAITVNSPPQQQDVINIRTSAELLDDSTDTLQGAVANLISNAELILDALNGGTGSTVYNKIFVGYPS
jgi:hypothetical protein